MESTFSMIKAKFRDHVRKAPVAMVNAVLCKLIQETLELGIDVELAP